MAENKNVEVYFFDGMFSKAKLVLDKQTKEAIFYGTRNKLIGSWKQESIDDEKEE